MAAAARAGPAAGKRRRFIRGGEQGRPRGCVWSRCRGTIQGRDGVVVVVCPGAMIGIVSTIQARARRRTPWAVQDQVAGVVAMQAAGDRLPTFVISRTS